MKIGDLVQFVGSWSSYVTAPFPKTGIVTGVWTNGRTEKISSADVLWDTGTHGNVLALSLAVINENR